MILDLLDKISVKTIIRDHFLTLNDFSSGKLKVSDFFLFISFPLAFSGVITFLFNVRFSDSLASSLITALSIFVGLLFSLLLLTFDNLSKKKEEPKKVTYIKIHKELFANISFSVLLSLSTILLILIAQISPDSSVLNVAAVYFTITFLIEFVLVLLMILQRIYSIFQFENR